MSCQRHPNRPRKCGCYALCVECRASHPTGCNCDTILCAKHTEHTEPVIIEKPIKKQIDLEAKHEIEERDQIIQALERKISTMEIDRQIDLIRKEQQIRQESKIQLDRLYDMANNEKLQMDELIKTTSNFGTLRKNNLNDVSAILNQVATAQAELSEVEDSGPIEDEEDETTAPTQSASMLELPLPRPHPEPEPEKKKKIIKKKKTMTKEKRESLQRLGILKKKAPKKDVLQE